MESGLCARFRFYSSTPISPPPTVLTAEAIFQHIFSSWVLNTFSEVHIYLILKIYVHIDVATNTYVHIIAARTNEQPSEL